MYRQMKSNEMKLAIRITELETRKAVVKRSNSIAIDVNRPS